MYIQQSNVPPTAGKPKTSNKQCPSPPFTHRLTPSSLTPFHLQIQSNKKSLNARKTSTIPARPYRASACKIELNWHCLDRSCGAPNFHSQRPQTRPETYPEKLTGDFRSWGFSIEFGWIFRLYYRSQLMSGDRTRKNIPKHGHCRGTRKPEANLRSNPA